MESEKNFRAESEGETRRVGSDLAARLKAGDTVFLEGELGAGKTTLVRGLLAQLGHTDPVRSPTFGIIQVFETHPPVMHADLYRVDSYKGIGLEEYLATHVCLIEWPDRAHGLVPEGSAWTVRIEFAASGRLITVSPPRS